MITAPYIIPECYADTNLIGYLLSAKVNHQKGCCQVTNTMNKGKNADGFSVGIVDDDKTKSSYVKEFESVAVSEHLELMKHPERHHYIILIKKAIEDFVLSAASEVKFDFAEIGLKNGLEGLKEATKRCQANEDPLLRRAFVRIEDAREMRILRNVLRYLNEKKYGAEREVLMRLFE